MEQSSRTTGGAWRYGALAAILAVSSANGQLASPLFDMTSFYVGWMVPSLLRGEQMLLALNGALLTLLTMSVAGIPAAIYERLAGARGRAAVSLAIWLAAALVCAAPGMLGLAGYFELD